MGFVGIDLDKKVLPEDYFELTNGQRLESLMDLLNALNSMNEETFRHHTLRSRNDFEEWIMEGYGDEKLSKRVGKAKTREKMVRILSKILKKEGEREKSNKIKIIKNKKVVLEQIGRFGDEM